MEQKIKTLLGEYAFTIVALQDQIEHLTADKNQLQEQIKEYEDKPKRSKSD